MEPVALFRSTLSSFEHLPLLPVLEYEIFNLLHKAVPDGHSLSNEENAEWIAFRFREQKYSGNQNPSRYYKPVMTVPNEDGLEEEFPSVDMITVDSIHYWTGRADYTKHPVLAARYAGLVYEFSFQVTGSKVSFAIAKKYVESLLAIIDQQLYKIPVYAITKAARALEVSLLYRNQELIQKSKISILSLEKRIAVDDKPGLWGFSYELLVNGKKSIATEVEEQVIIEDLEQRFSRMIMADSWCAECAARLLMGYYHQKKAPEHIKRILISLEKSYIEAKAGRSSFQVAHDTELLYQFYRQYQLNEEAEVFLQRLREVSKSTDSDMKRIGTEVKISQEKIDQYVELILADADLEVVASRIAEFCTPQVNQIKNELDAMAKQAPLMYKVSLQLVDKKGRRIATIGPLEEDREGRLVKHYGDAIRIGTIGLHYILDEAVQREVLSTHEFIKLMKQSCVIDPNRYPLLEKAVNAYLQKDYVVFMHIMIPQFEEAIRNLIEKNNGIVMVQKGDAYNLKTFDHLLSDDIVTNVFGEDRALFFKAIFTDRRGWNLRNQLAHGMMDYEHMTNKQNSDTILHAFLCLAFVRYEDNVGEDNTSVS